MVRSDLVILVLALVGFFGYRYLNGTRTCAFYEETRIVGSVLTPRADAYLHDHPGADCEELLKAYTGVAKDVWTEASLLQSELLLSVTYISVLPLLAIASIASLQTLRCSRSRR